MAKKKPNPNRIPKTIVEAKRESMKRGMYLGITTMFYALLDNGFLTKEQVPDACEKVEYVVDSVEKGYVNVADMIKTLHIEYGINYQ